MELVEKYREIILQVFREHTEAPISHGDLEDEIIVDREGAITCGWSEDIRNINEFTPVLPVLILLMESCGFKTIIPKASHPIWSDTVFPKSISFWDSAPRMFDSTQDMRLSSWWAGNDGDAHHEKGVGDSYANHF